MVYEYADNLLLVHRLLMYEDNKICCKGDNSFRLERINHDKVVGKVVGKVVMAKRGNKLIRIPKVSERFLKDSYYIGVLFENFNNDVMKLKNSKEYKMF